MSKYIFDTKRQVGQESWPITQIGGARKATPWERLFKSKELYNSEKEAFIAKVLERSGKINWGQNKCKGRTKMAEGLRDRMFSEWPDLRVPTENPQGVNRVKCLGIGYPHWRGMEFLVSVVYTDHTIGVIHEFLAVSARVSVNDFIHIG